MALNGYVYVWGSLSVFKLGMKCCVACFLAFYLGMRVKASESQGFFYMWGV